MSGLDIFALIVLIVLIVAAVVIWFLLAMLPGQIAKKRNHPQAEAINIGGWLGALLGGGILAHRLGLGLHQTGSVNV